MEHKNKECIKAGIRTGIALIFNLFLMRKR